jgi:hypothetical protein
MVLASFVGTVFVPMLFVCFELLGSWRPALLAERHKQV